MRQKENYEFTIGYAKRIFNGTTGSFMIVWTKMFIKLLKLVFTVKSWKWFLQNATLLRLNGIFFVWKTFQRF